MRMTPSLGMVISASPPESNDHDLANSSSGVAARYFLAAATLAGLASPEPEDARVVGDTHRVIPIQINSQVVLTPAEC